MPYPPPPYDDAKCGAAKCGAAVCGKLWAYPARGTLTLSGRPASYTITSGGSAAVLAGRGVLTLRGRSPILHVSSNLATQRGVLTLVGRDPAWAGERFLWIESAECTDIDLVPLSSR